MELIKNIFRNKHTAYIVILLFTAVYFLPGLLSPRDFWVEDEARYAEIMREMLVDGHWLVPHLNGHYYPHNPPLFFWLAFITTSIFGGINVHSMMIVTWLSLVGIVCALYRLALYMFDARIASLSSYIIMSMFLMIAGSGLIRIDMLMTYFVVLAMSSFWKGYTKDSYFQLFLFWVYSSLAVMSNGALGLLLIFAPALIFLVIQKKGRLILKMIFNPGLIILCLFVGGWVYAAWKAGYQDIVKKTVFDQILGISSNSFIQQQPFYFYLLLFIPAGLPWSIFLFRGLYFFYKQQKKDLFLFLSLWFFVGLTIISVLSGKMFIYLLPILPPVAIIIAKSIKDYLNYQGSFNFKAELIISTVLLFGVLAIVPIFAKSLIDLDENYFFQLSIASIIFGLVNLIFILKSLRKYIFIFFIFCMAFYNSFVFLWVAPKIDTYLSTRTIGLELLTYINKNYRIGIYDDIHHRGIFSFYSNHKFKEIEIEKIAEYLSECNDNLLLTKKSFIKRFTGPDKLKKEYLEIMNEYKIANYQYQLLRMKN